MRRSILDPRNRRGFTLILMTIMMTLMMGAAAFGVDFSRMYMYRAQLQTAADAAALAGAQRLMYQDTAGANDSAVVYAARHKAGSAALSMPLSDVEPGVWTMGGGGTFTVAGGGWSSSTVNAVRVTARYTGTYTFGRIFGFDSKALTASAIAVWGSASGTSCTRPWGIPYQLMLNALTTFFGGPARDATTYNLTTEDISNLASMTELQNVSLKVGDNSDGVISGNFYGVKLPPILYADGTLGNPWSGGNDYSTAIGESCAALAAQMALQGANPYVSIGDWLAPENGNKQGPTRQGFQDLCNLNGNNWDCPEPVRITAAFWDVSGDAPGTSGCGGKCFHVKYMGVFYVTRYNTTTDAVEGFFKTMAGGNGFSTTPGPIQKIALVR